MAKQSRSDYQDENYETKSRHSSAGRHLIQDDTAATYFQQIKVFPLLTFEEELELAGHIQKGDIAAKNRLINSNLRLVVKIAQLYTARDVSFMDLIQEGNMGLMHAAEKYDPQKNVRFCTYASWWIRQFISRYLTNKRRLVRLPHRKEEILRKIQRTYHSLSQSLMHQPRNKDIAQELGISVKDVDFIINMSSGPLSLEMDPSEAENAAVIEFQEDYTYNPERSLFRQSSKDGTMHVLNKLKDRERRVLAYRYQLNGGKRHTLREIGDKMDISAETVRQIELKALKKIRSHADELKDCVCLEAM
jgi:RNA polymerase primary sigma factor